MPTVKIDLGRRSYPALIGAGASNSISSLLLKHAAESRVFVVQDARFYALHGRALIDNMRTHNITVIELTIPLTERSKSRSGLNQLIDFFLGQKISRSDFILACGGGVASDLVGFAAATVLRGISWGIVSSTLLGMVDAAIGGKTGINHPAGKNLIGAFWQPAFVICDLNYLHTLSDRQFMSGMGEIVKYAGLKGGQMLPDCEALLTAGRDNKRLLSRLVTQSIRYKADIVSMDETEGKLRMVLNLGHTFGHAIERVLGYRGLHHGEAVLIGLLGAISLSELINIRSKQTLLRYKQLILQYLGIVPKRTLGIATLREAMETDKKRVGKVNRFIVLDRPGKPRIIQDVDRHLVDRSIQQMVTEYNRGRS